MRAFAAGLVSAALILPVSCARTDAAKFAAGMDAFCKAHGFNGAMLVAERGRVIFSGGYGFADAETRLPNTAETTFKIASLTKPFTAVAVMQLAERGLLSLDDPVSAFIPEYPAGDSVRVRHLLSHTSGVPEYATVAFLGRADRPFAQEDLLKAFKSKGLRFPPGSAFEYSNSNYVLLGLIIERVSGLSYGAFVAERICRPAGMDATRYGGAPAEAVGYLRLTEEGGVLKAAPAFPLDLSSQFSSAGLVSSVADLYKWDRALRAGIFLKKRSIALMETPAAGASDYGLGWRIERPGRKPAVQHSGTIPGGAGTIYRDTARDRTIIILSNVQNADLASLRGKALELFASSR